MPLLCAQDVELINRHVWSCHCLLQKPKQARSYGFGCFPVEEIMAVFQRALNPQGLAIGLQAFTEIEHQIEFCDCVREWFRSYHQSGQIKLCFRNILQRKHYLEEWMPWLGTNWLQVLHQAL